MMPSEHRNTSTRKLLSLAATRNEGVRTATGSIAVLTGRRTGRSPDDVYVVPPEGSPWQGTCGKAIEQQQFTRLQRKVAHYLADRDRFVVDGYYGVHSTPYMNVTVICEYAWHALFSNNMFSAGRHMNGIPLFTVVAAPGCVASPAVDGTSSEAFIAIDLNSGVALIGGTAYAGEIKNSIFIALNQWLPTVNVLSLHCGARCAVDGKSVAVLVGLSGTGKTTLSADASAYMVADDEIAWNETGVLNLEAGSYITAFGLDPKDHPTLHAAALEPGATFENLHLLPDGSPDFADCSITENTCCSISLAKLRNAWRSRSVSHPQNVILLTADALGVLPAVAYLTPSQLLYHFVCGYTARIAGSEVSVDSTSATFSPCFAAPFLPRPPVTYARLLAKRLDTLPDVACWIVNTGWFGPPEQSLRIPLEYTRLIVAAITTGELANLPRLMDTPLGFGVPERIPGVPENFLHPASLWQDETRFRNRRLELASRLSATFTAHGQGLPEAVARCGLIT